MKRRLRLTYGDIRVVGRLVCLFRRHRRDGRSIRYGVETPGLTIDAVCIRCGSQKPILATLPAEAA